MKLLYVLILSLFLVLPSFAETPSTLKQVVANMKPDNLEVSIDALKVPNLAMVRWGSEEGKALIIFDADYLKALKTPDDVAVIVGHELSHIYGCKKGYVYLVENDLFFPLADTFKPKVILEAACDISGLIRAEEAGYKVSTDAHKLLLRFLPNNVLQHSIRIGLMEIYLVGRSK